MTRIAYVLLACLALVLSGASCGKLGSGSHNKGGFDRVLILYSAGSNSLSRALDLDIEDVKKSWLPRKSAGTAVVAAIHRRGTPAVIVRMYRDKKDRPVADTLKTLENSASLVDPDVMRETLAYIRDNFRSEHYRMEFSSHASDWLPDSGWTFEPPTKSVSRTSGNVRPNSIGQEEVSGRNYEMTVDEFKDAIPMRLDALLFDACLMAGVEVAYALRDICDYMALSPAEVMAEGFDYSRLVADLLQKDAAMAVRDVCAHFFEQYDQMPDDDRGKSATVSAVSTSAMEDFAGICRDLFSRYRAGLERPARVPQYFDGSNKTYYNAALGTEMSLHWCYDLQDVMSAAGISVRDMELLQAALDEVVYYKATTKRRYSMGTPHWLDIEAFCGLTMYLPSLGSDTMTDYYRTLEWNRVTGLVE